MAQSTDGVSRLLEFLRYLEGWLSRDGSRQLPISRETPVGEREYLMSWLTSDRVLATCWCQELDLPPGSTYADAARKVLEELDGLAASGSPD